MSVASSLEYICHHESQKPATNMVGDPPKNQAAKEQTKERRAADHSRHKRRQLHGGRKLNNGVTIE